MSPLTGLLATSVGALIGVIGILWYRAELQRSNDGWDTERRTTNDLRAQLDVEKKTHADDVARLEVVATDLRSELAAERKRMEARQVPGAAADKLAGLGGDVTPLPLPPTPPTPAVGFTLPAAPVIVLPFKPKDKA